MGLHKGFDRSFFTIDGNVKTSGGSKKLAKGQFGIVDIDTAPSSAEEGSPLVASFAGKSKKSKFRLKLGKVDLEPTRSIDNKSWASLPFTLDDVVEVRVDAPDTKDFSVDEFVIGFNGEDGTEIDLSQGDNEIFQLGLKGKAMAYLGYKGGAVVQFQMTAPDNRDKSELAVAPAGTWTNQEIVEDTVERLKNYTLLGQNLLTDYVDISIVNSNYPETIPGTDQTFYELTVQDNGTYSDLARVQAQYPTLDVKVKEIEEDFTTYVTVGTALPAAYTKSLKDLLKGCEDCPAGYTEIAQGFVYSIAIEDNGTDDSANVELAVPGVEVGSVSRNGGEAQTGIGFYSAVTDDALTQAEIDTFIGTYPTAIVELVSKDVTDLCTNATTTSTAWVTGDTCKVSTETWTLTVKDDECGNSRLAEIQANYGSQFTIVEDSVNDGCTRTYSTTVTTNLVCEECDNIFRDVFTSEAPADFDLVPWKKAPKVYDGTAKMGIKFKAKKNILAGDEEYRDEMDFIAESVRLSLVGGFPADINESYTIGGNGRYTVKLLSRYEPPKNYGGNLRCYEDMSRVYFEGQPRHKGNNYAKWAYGEETVLKATAQYVDYVIKIQTRKYQDPVNGQYVNSMDYHVWAEVGRHQDVEDLINDLASAAGIPGVQAYAKG